MAESTAPFPQYAGIRVSAAGQPEVRFSSSFRIGRVDDCQVVIKNEYVSRVHAEISIENGRWLVRDLGSSNGMFVDGNRVQAVPIENTLTVQLGIEGPFVTFAVEQPEPPPAPPSPAEPLSGSTALYAARYFSNAPSSEPFGVHTMMVRRAFQKVQKKQKRRHYSVIAGLAALVVIIAGYAWYQHVRIAQQTATAKELFYTMKSLRVDIATVEQLVRDSGNKQAADQVQKYQVRQREMEKNYDRFLTSLRVYDPKMTEEQRLILRVARIFGECELDMPPAFATEVHNYIKKWQSSGRFAKDVRTATENGYIPTIAREFLAQDLPPQFFYLALQESDFDPFNSGPPTYKGIAKGMWQFIPETAVKYGLRIGPLAEFRRPDPMDDRHKWEKATAAAARYIKFIYSTDAQASGLLVIASYNWGEQKVIPIIKSMPANPRERNFWRLLTDHRDKLPGETYDYVFYIISAAVIGENPRLFGFPFDNPLAAAENR